MGSGRFFRRGRWRFGRRPRVCDSAGGVAGFVGKWKVCAARSLAGVNFECEVVAVWGVKACGRRRVGVSKTRDAIRRRSSFYKTLARREKVGANQTRVSHHPP